MLEGGSIDTNGAGTLLTTEECLLSEVQQRNPGVSREQLEQVFTIFWASIRLSGWGAAWPATTLMGMWTTSRALLARTTIVTAVEPNANDENHAPLAENLDRLKAARTLDGKQFDDGGVAVASRPWCFQRQRLPASYANFYIANGLVLVPTFHDPNDRMALNILAEVFPDREVIGIHCVDLIWGLGTLHCMTQQQPKAAASTTP